MLWLETDPVTELLQFVQDSSRDRFAMTDLRCTTRAAHPF